MSKQTTRLEVVVDGAKWAVREQGIGRLTSHPDQKQATAAARVVAANHPRCELIIRNSDGSIQSQETFDLPTK
jgi:hypothetical protein